MSIIAENETGETLPSHNHYPVIPWGRPCSKRSCGPLIAPTQLFSVAWSFHRVRAVECSWWQYGRWAQTDFSNPRTRPGSQQTLIHSSVTAAPEWKVDKANAVDRCAISTPGKCYAATWASAGTKLSSPWEKPSWPLLQHPIIAAT